MFQPRYSITPALLERIKRITLLVHELNRRHVSEVAMMQLQDEARAVSAYASTSIEGNPLPLTEVKRLLKNQPQQARQSEREVINYNYALAQLVSTAHEPFDKAFLLKIHRGVMQDLLPEHQIGQFRRDPIVVRNPRSGEIIYLPPDHGDVEDLVDELLTFVQENQAALDPVLLAGIFHRQLVIIHPFVDGNGRTTRLASTAFLYGLGLNISKLFSFENYYNKNVTRYFQYVGVSGNYYDLTDNVDFTPWLEYFAGGILDELLRVEKEIERRGSTPADRLKAHHQLILDYIDEHGFITDRDYAQLTERAKATRTLDFKKLLKLDLIERIGKGRSIYYKRK